MECLLCSGHCSKCFACINYLSPTTNLWASYYCHPDFDEEIATERELVDYLPG